MQTVQWVCTMHRSFIFALTNLETKVLEYYFEEESLSINYNCLSVAHRVFTAIQYVARIQQLG